MRDGVIPRRSPSTNISEPEGSDSTRSSASGTAWRRAASNPDRNWGGNSAGSGVNSGRSARTRERSASASDVFPSHRRRIPLRRKISARNGRGASVNREPPRDRFPPGRFHRHGEPPDAEFLRDDRRNRIEKPARRTVVEIRRGEFQQESGLPGRCDPPGGGIRKGEARRRYVGLT